MDKEAYLQEAMRQLNNSEIYQPLVKGSTRDMIKKVNKRIQELHGKGNTDDKNRHYLLVSGEERAGRFYLLPKHTQERMPGVASNIELQHTHRDFKICRSLFNTFGSRA